jgi:hypothetical protein
MVAPTDTAGLEGRNNSDNPYFGTCECTIVVLQLAQMTAQAATLKPRVLYQTPPVTAAGQYR